MNKDDLIKALNQIEEEKGIDKEIIFEAIETSLVMACKKNYGVQQDSHVVMNRETGEVKVFAKKTVVETVVDDSTEISLDDARNINVQYDYGDIAEVEVTPKDFGRIAAQTAKQIVVQKLRDAEREILYSKYIKLKDEMLPAIVQKRDRKNIVVTINDIEAILPPGEQMPNELFEHNERILVYVTEVKQETKGPIITVSRARPELVKRLFEQNVAEVFDGTVEIKAISREAGSRTKIAVWSKDPNVDAVGACVGNNGIRVNAIVKELKGEKIDIVNWKEDPSEFIKEALSPSDVITVKLDEENKSAKVIVPDDQLSLAIGKVGQNARLAVRLTDWKIDIKSKLQAEQTDFLSDDYNKDSH